MAGFTRSQLQESPAARSSVASRLNLTASSRESPWQPRAEVLARSFPMKSFSGSAAFLSVFTHSLIAPRIREFQPWVRSSRILAGILGLLAGLCRSPGCSLSSRSQHSVRLRSGRPGLFCKALLSYTDTPTPSLRQTHQAAATGYTGWGRTRVPLFCGVASHHLGRGRHGGRLARNGT